MVSSRASIFRRLPDAAGAIRHYRGLIGPGSTRAELAACQRRRLVETARRASAASPLYRELYSGLELTSDLDIRELPVVTKAMLMDHFDDRMGIFVYDRSEWREYAAVMLRWAELMGLRPRLGRRVRIASVGAHRRRAPYRGDDGQHPQRLGHRAVQRIRHDRRPLWQRLRAPRRNPPVRGRMLVEVVDQHDDPVPTGVIGAKLVITSFVKRTQPLLRYELTDRASLSTTPCPCGLPFARVLSLEGRNDDILHFKGADGRAIALHPLTLRSPMAGLVELRQYKIILADDGLRVLVTPRDGIAPYQIAQRIDAMLRAKLVEAGVADVRLKVEIMPELPRDQGHGAKFKLIESRPSTTR